MGCPYIPLRVRGTLEIRRKVAMNQGIVGRNMSSVGPDE